MKTFVTDQIRNLILNLVLNFALVWLLYFLHTRLQDWLILLFAGAVFVITLAISFLYPILSRIGNKFVPLEEGELKNSLMGLLEKHGYHVKAIEVITTIDTIPIRDVCQVI
jgi:STE24 endopeptidase